MAIYKENDFDPENQELDEASLEGEIIESNEIGMYLEDIGVELRVTMLLDKDGNPTEVFFDACTALGQAEDGQWFEVDIKHASWQRPTLH